MKLQITLTGDGPMLMHAERLANPLDDLVIQMKEITSKRKKTEQDMAALARLEFEGGLYLAGDAGPCIPTWNIKKCFVEGGRINKLGKHIERAMALIDQDAILVYAGPRDVDGLWAAKFYDMRSVKVGTSKVTRCRPRFANWTASFLVELDDSIINVHEFEAIAERAGRMVGIGDFRQRYGRFTVEMEAA
ncbi:MAG: hypothetical protein AB7O86_05665 [Porticoccaceae bacterium]